MPLSDAVKLIKGPKGTNVILTLKKVDGEIVDLKIKRDIVLLEETYLRSSVVSKHENLYGFINLPKFYIDFDNSSSRDAARDVKKEIERLKSLGVKGIVLDLRNNGGGSLKTVVEMAGLFIQDGPIVQVRSMDKDSQVLKDKDRSITWEGPLVILVNEFSASASEILAAAMQDYKRAIIIGGKQTYGKGTVQNVLDLNRMVKNNTNGDLGALKFTTQKYYRINGGSTQLEGVKSDIVVPNRYTYVDFGEKDQENPLEWDKIDPVSYKPWKTFFDYNKTIQASKDRMESSDFISLIDDNAKWIKSIRDRDIYDLNYKKFILWVSKNRGDYPILNQFHFRNTNNNKLFRKVESFNVRYKKRFNNISFNVPTLKLSEPLRFRRVRAIRTRANIPSSLNQQQPKNESEVNNG